MSNTETDARQSFIPIVLGKTTQDTRFDPAHPISGQDPQSMPAPSSDSAKPAPIPPPNEPSKDDSQSQRMERQAAQLADYLRDRQRDLDRRESQLNAAIAQMESELRAARLWLADQETEQTKRQQDLDAREQDLLQRLQRLAAAEAALKRKSQSPAEPVFPDAQVQITSEQLARQAAAHQEERRQELEAAENRLAQANAEVKKLQEQLTADRRQFQAEMHSQRRQFILQQRQSLAEVEKKRQALQLRGEHVDQCGAALMQLRGELQKMHRETLEIRLATEELWVQLSGAAPPAALTRSLGQIRTRLADQYRLANAELLQQKKELESIRDQLAEHYHKLLQQKRQFEHWMSGKQEETQEQSSRLIARENELLKQQTHFEEHLRQWQVERMQYEQEILRLHVKVMNEEC